MGVPWSVRVDGAKPNKIAKVFRRIGQDSNISLKRAAYEMARATEREVRQLYYRYARGHRPGELESKIVEAGKERGAEAPARSPGDPSASSMLEIGRNIVTQPTGRQSGYYMVRVDPSAMSSQTSTGRPFGLPLSQLAEFIEQRISTVWPVTLRMIGYLMTIRRGKGGFGTRKRNFYMPNRQVAGTMVVTPPDMPVWKVVASRLTQLLPLVDGELRSLVLKAIQQFG